MRIIRTYAFGMLPLLLAAVFLLGGVVQAGALSHHIQLPHAGAHAIDGKLSPADTEMRVTSTQAKASGCQDGHHSPSGKGPDSGNCCVSCYAGTVVESDFVPYSAAGVCLFAAAYSGLAAADLILLERPPKH